MSENMQFAMLVVATGLIVVFGALVLSTFLIYLYGKIITFAQGKASGRRKKSGEKKQAQPPVPVPKAAPAALALRQEDDGELIAVIAAAVHEMYADTGRQYVVKSVRRASSGRPVWAAAGLLDSTRPF